LINICDDQLNGIIVHLERDQVTKNEEKVTLFEKSRALASSPSSRFSNQGGHHGILAYVALGTQSYVPVKNSSMGFYPT
jgi:hypothetical protein